MRISFLILGLTWFQRGFASSNGHGKPDTWIQDCERNYPDHETVVRDVVIVGGGASGTYSAIKLRDMKYTVSLIEQKERLGGHTETYMDLQDGMTYEYGVIVFHDSDIVHRYFNRLGIPLMKAASFEREFLFFDFSTGRRANYTAPDPLTAISAYTEQLKKYPYLEDGFDLPDPVPEDLLIPFGEFVRKYDLDDMVRIGFRYGQGLGDFLQIPTIYVMKNFGLDIIRNFRSSFLTTARRNNSELYGKAQSELGPDVYLKSTIISTSRGHPSSTGHSVRVLVQTPSGPKLILTKQLLIAIPPVMENLQSLDLDSREEKLFSRFQHSYYFSGLLNNTGLLEKRPIQNADSQRPFALPNLPAVYGFGNTPIPGLVDFKYGAPIGATQTSTEDVKSAILSTLERLRQAGDLQFSKTEGEPGFSAFANHSPFELIVTAEEIRKGFYRQLNELQGYRDVWWTGAAWHTQDSSLLWQFTETVVNRLVKRL